MTRALRELKLRDATMGVAGNSEALEALRELIGEGDRSFYRWKDVFCSLATSLCRRGREVGCRMANRPLALWSPWMWQDTHDKGQSDNSATANRGRISLRLFARKAKLICASFVHRPSSVLLWANPKKHCVHTSKKLSSRRIRVHLLFCFLMKCVCLIKIRRICDLDACLDRCIVSQTKCRSSSRVARCITVFDTHGWSIEQKAVWQWSAGGHWSDQSSRCFGSRSETSWPFRQRSRSAIASTRAEAQNSEVKHKRQMHVSHMSCAVEVAFCRHAIRNDCPFGCHCCAYEWI